MPCPRCCFPSADTNMHILAECRVRSLLCRSYSTWHCMGECIPLHAGLLITVFLAILFLKAIPLRDCRSRADARRSTDIEKEQFGEQMGQEKSPKNQNSNGNAEMATHERGRIGRENLRN